MAEPSKDRDKAVEEALENLAGVYMNDSRPPFPEECRRSDRITLNLLWQRAQEAEREENYKAVCVLCRSGEPVVRLGELPDGWGHTVEVLDRLQNVRCFALAIRNRAARASEEPKVAGHHPDCAAAPNVDNGYPSEACDCK